MLIPDALRSRLPWERLRSVFLFVTSRCNSRCRTCFNHKVLNRGDDMTFEQIRTISTTAPRFRKLWLSGGEPFMRDDLVEIIECFYRQNGVKVINLPTNGLLPERIESGVAQLLDRCPDLEIHLNFSLDALGATHDAIRGVPGGFRQTVASLDRMAARFGDNPRLIRNVATIITRDGYDEILKLAAYLERKGNHCAHVFETVRGEPRDPSMQRVTRQELAALHDRLMAFYEETAGRIFTGVDPRGRWLARAVFLAVMKYHYRIHEENLEGPRSWGMRCTAGKTTLVVDHDGAFRACELRPPVGRLQDHGLDLTAALRSSALRREVEAIGGGYRAGCWCTHSCWILSSLQFSPAGIMLRVPWSLLRHKLQRLPRYQAPALDLEAIEADAPQARPLQSAPPLRSPGAAPSERSAAVIP